MRNPWFARLMIILAVLIWGGYTILPTLMQESASERLANQALQAQGEEVETSTAEDDKRLPEAAHLPQQLRSIVLERTRNCRAACKIRGSLPSGKTTRFGWRFKRTVSFEISDIMKIFFWLECLPQCMN